MATDAIPATVARFVAAYVASVVDLEAILYFRAHPDQEISITAVADALYVDRGAAARTLQALHRHGILRAASDDGPFAYAPSEELRKDVDELADTYRTRLVPLHHFIHERAQATSAESFANAFRLRKD